MECSVIWQEHHVTVRFGGPCSIAGIAHVSRKGQGDWRFDDLSGVLYDFQNVTALAFTHSEVLELAATDAVAGGTNPRLKIAVVGTLPALGALVRMYQSAALRPPSFEQFETMEGADRWLGRSSVATGAAMLSEPQT